MDRAEKDTGRMGDELLERDAELGSLLGAVAEASTGTGRTVVVEGAAGIGKSALLRAVDARAEGAGHLVLRAVGHRFEQDHPLGGYLQWLGPLSSTVAADERWHLIHHLLEEGRPRSGSDMPAVLHVTRRLLEDLAGSAAHPPLILLCDDLQWLDEPSIRVLHHLVAHLDRLPVAVVAALRTGEPLSPLLDEVRTKPTTTVLRPRPLSVEAVGRLVAGSGTVDVASVEEVHRLTRGNPLLVDELRRSVGSVDAGALDVDDTRSFLQATTIARLERVSASDRHLATVAALVPHASLAEAAEIAGASKVDASRGVKRLVELGILEDTHRLEFTHPLIGETVADLLAPPEQQAVHERAASVLDLRGAGVDRIAPHLVACPPRGNERTAALLHRAARRAWSAGTPAVAHRWLRRALVEPAAPADRPRIALDVVRAAASLGLPGWREDLRDLLERTPDERRWRVQLAVGRALRDAGRLRDAVSVFSQARDCVPHEDRLAGLEALTDLAIATRTHVPVDLTPTEELLTVVDAPNLGTTPIERAALGIVAYHLAITVGPSPRVIELASRSLGLDHLREDVLRTNSAMPYAVLALLFSDALLAARSVLDIAVPDAERRGATLQAAVLRNYSGVIDLETGELHRALAELSDACSVLERAHAASLPGAVSNLAVVLLELDRLDDAVEVLELPGGEGRWRQTASYTSWLHSRALVREASGDLDGALADALECGRRQAQMAATHPSSVPWRATAARVHARLGDEASARAMADENLASCPEGGSRHCRSDGLRTLALLDRPGDRPVTLRRALDALEGSPSRRRRIWTLVELGTALRARGDRGRAQAVLRDAEDLARRASMVAAARAAAAELDVLGGGGRSAPVSGPDALTASERRVAELAVAGASNREIAAQLYVSTKAVEFHLTNAYRKLGISSRADLPRALAS